jgi:TolB-like protein
MGPGDDRKSIVVLPFDNMSPDPADAYFADGLTEELIADLSGVHALRVISRTSAMSFKDSRLDLRAIAGQLKVRYVLEGSVRRAGDTLRVTAQLIDADADSHLWAEKYSGKLEDVFDLQEQLSRQIVSVLRLRLSPAEESQLLARPIPDVRAYEHYLRARANIYSFDAPSIERAIRDLRAALDLLGDNALFLRALGMAHFQEMNAGLTEDPAVIDRIEECGRRIAAVRQDDAGAFLLLGLAHWMRGDCRSAVVSLRNGYRRDHTDPDIMLFLAVMSLSTGQVDLAGDLVRELHRVDPLAPLSPLLVGFHHLFEGRFAQAADFLDRAVELGPEVIVVRCLAVRVFIAAGKHDRAVESARFLRDRVPGSAFSESADLFVRGLTAKGGDVPRPSPTLQTYVERDCEMAQYLSDAYAFAGDPKKALSTLEMAFRTGFMNDAYLTRHDPFISSVRDSPEWKALLIRMLQGRREFEAALPSLP